MNVIINVIVDMDTRQQSDEILFVVYYIFALIYIGTYVLLIIDIEGLFLICVDKMTEIIF